jgi:hypothetical protein
MLHPWFEGTNSPRGESEVAAVISFEIWVFACTDTVSNVNDMRMNPLAPSSTTLEKLECARMLVCAGNKNGSSVLRGHCDKL